MQRIKTLIDTPDLDPVAFLDFDRQDPYTGASSAPYRLDCALTYRLPDGGQHVAPLERVKRELLDVEWKQILDKAWQAGIPHAVFTGGEPTLRPDLADLIEYTEQLGMVAGLITDGLRLSESKYLHALLQAGLDHVMLLLDPNEEQSWEALRDVLSEDIAVVVHLTITGYSPEQFPALLDRLAGMGVQNISLSAESTGLKDALLAARQAVAEKQMRLIWDLPVPYTHFHPVAIELAEEMEGVDAVDYGPGHAWLYVEPDGDVLTGQGYYQTVLGNLLMDSWDKVWEKAKTAVSA
jgi:MoaA/NifB/PqqE/SkfB family radical SAM enzyme